MSCLVSLERAGEIQKFDIWQQNLHWTINCVVLFYLLYFIKFIFFASLLSLRLTLPLNCGMTLFLCQNAEISHFLFQTYKWPQLNTKTVCGMSLNATELYLFTQMIRSKKKKLLIIPWTHTKKSAYAFCYVTKNIYYAP